jgi:glycosyltransferase involved in cell wall biosynthesis
VPHSNARAASFEVHLGEQRHEIPYSHDFRIDLARDGSIDGEGNQKLLSGFWLPISVDKRLIGTTCQLSIALKLSSGDSHALVRQNISFKRRPANILNGQLAKRIVPKVAVCMTTFEPDLRLFERQVRSLREQTFRDWICFVQDDCSRLETFHQIERLCHEDPRFIVMRNEQNLGFYRNFERCLSCVPSEIEFVALCDQDDYWYPNKLAQTLDRFSDGVELVYSDMRLVNRDGAVLSDTYWHNRRNNFSDFEALMVTNTVTGAASMLRSSTLQKALPFPEPVGTVFHDHWLACVAMVAGRLEYIDQPLYDYTQHDGNILGHSEIREASLKGELLKVVKVMGQPSRLYNALMSTMDRYYEDYRRLALYGQVLDLRFAHIEASKRKAIHLFSDRLRNAFDLALGGPASEERRQTTGNADVDLGISILAHKVVRPALPPLVASLNLARSAKASLSAAAQATRDFARGTGENGGWRELGMRALLKDKARSVVRALAPAASPSKEASYFEASAARLPLSALPVYSVPRTQPRINLVVDTFGADWSAGGQGAALLFAALLAERKQCDLRVISRGSRGNPSQLAGWLEQAKIAPPANIELQALGRHNPRLDLDLGSNELFLTTSWRTTASVRRTAAASRIIYLVHEDERLQHPSGDEHLRCSEALNDGDIALLVDSRLLFDQLAQSQVLRFAERAVWFEPAVAGELYFAEHARSGRSKNRFFFDARPHEPSALFERGIEAIRAAIAADVLSPKKWELHLAGRDIPRTTLAGSIQPAIHENMGTRAHAGLMRSSDLGLCLAYTAHPGNSVLQLAATGAVCVTNRFGLKQSLDSYSKNIICADVEVPALVAAIADGVRLAEDRPTRAANQNESRIPRDWRESFATALDRLADRV